jgi:YcaO-like protein with predicted kinase domain
VTAGTPGRAPIAPRLRQTGEHRKLFRRGTHRSLPPAETVERLLPLTAAVGITRIANLTGLDVIGLPVVQVVRPNARSNGVFQGKGLDLAAAKASALMEAIETWHAERILAPMRFASAAALQGMVRLIDADRLPRMAGSPFHPNLELLWIEGEDLLTREPVWLPYECVHARFTLPYPPGSGCFACTTNGLASGNHRLEALVQGLCEVIERDAAALLERDPSAAARRRLDLASVEDPDCRDLIETIRRAGLDLAVWDLTTDIGVAAFGCRIMEGPQGPGLVALPAEGQGCHPDRGIALARALTEAAQSRLTAIAGARDDITRSRYGASLDAGQVAAWRERLERGEGRRLFADVPTHAFDAFEDEVAWILDRLRSSGIAEVAAVDLGPADGPYSVLRVVVPGLEGLPESGCLPGPRAKRRVDHR